MFDTGSEKTRSFHRILMISLGKLFHDFLKQNSFKCTLLQEIYVKTNHVVISVIYNFLILRKFLDRFPPLFVYILSKYRGCKDVLGNGHTG